MPSAVVSHGPAIRAGQATIPSMGMSSRWIVSAAPRTVASWPESAVMNSTFTLWNLSLIVSMSGCACSCEAPTRMSVPASPCANALATVAKSSSELELVRTTGTESAHAALSFVGSRGCVGLGAGGETVHVLFFTSLGNAWTTSVSVSKPMLHVTWWVEQLLVRQRIRTILVLVRRAGWLVFRHCEAGPLRIVDDAGFPGSGGSCSIKNTLRKKTK